MDRRTKLILVVEDDGDIRDLLREFLESAGYEVRTAANGQEGLARLREDDFRLVLLDRNMERMDGKVFLDALHGDPELSERKVPVVMMSAAGVVRDERAHAFLKKPFDFEELQRVVAQFCGDGEA